MTNELKPCRVCGHEARIISDDLRFGIVCSKCGNATHWHNSVQDAVFEWWDINGYEY